MMAEVIDHDFGKADRETVRRFCRLMNILEQHERDVIADPGKYLTMAAKEVAETRHAIFEAWEVVAIATGATVLDYSAGPSLHMPEVIRVNAVEYRALREVYKRVAKLAGMSG